MITCPQCGAQNIPGLAYCENCGSPLPSQSAGLAPSAAQAAPAPSIATQPDPAAIALPQPVMPVDQPPAGPEMNVPSPAPSGANLVAADQAAPAAAATPSTADISSSSVATPAAPAPAAAGAATLTITFPSGQTFTMQDDVVNIGRADVAQNWHPELDVIPYGGGAPDLGVSRHQARLERQGSGFVVVDMGSTNGTYLNGHAAPYNQPVQLNDGDTLSFGALNTQVSIK